MNAVVARSGSCRSARAAMALVTAAASSLAASTGTYTCRPLEPLVLVAPAPSNSGSSRWVNFTPSVSGVVMAHVYPVPAELVWDDINGGREGIMAFGGWPEEALDFYEGLSADNTKTYWTEHKAVYQDK